MRKLLITKKDNNTDNYGGDHQVLLSKDSTEAILTVILKLFSILSKSKASWSSKSKIDI
jgi:hypothetical protein